MSLQACGTAGTGKNCFCLDNAFLGAQQRSALPFKGDVLMQWLCLSWVPFLALETLNSQVMTGAFQRLV